MNRPPSTAAELHDVLIGYDLSRDRTMQKELGPSEIGGACAAQIARKLAGAPAKLITEPMWAPFQGTAVHAEMEKVLAYWNQTIGRERWFAERELKIGEDIIGHGDAYDVDHEMVVDWKHAGTTTRREVLAAQRKLRPAAEQIKQLYRIQTHLYGLGFELTGRPVKWVRVVFLPRSWRFADAVEWTEQYNAQLVDWALLRYQSIKDMVAALRLDEDGDRIALVPTTPGSECAWCPFNVGGDTNWFGCAGDVERRARVMGRETSGIIA